MYGRRLCMWYNIDCRQIVYRLSLTQTAGEFKMHPIIKAANAIESCKTIPQLHAALRDSVRAFYAVWGTPMMDEYQKIIRDVTKITYNKIMEGIK